MRAFRLWSAAALVLASAAVMGCKGPVDSPATVSADTATPAQEIGGQEEFGPYEVVANWPQPLPDGPDGIKHEGWTWGSTGAVYAETPDRPAQVWALAEASRPGGADAAAILQTVKSAGLNADEVASQVNTRIAKRPKP